MDRSRQPIRYDERQLISYQQSFELAQINLIRSLEEEWFQKYVDEGIAVTE
jgi:hypothetical protein